MGLVKHSLEAVATTWLAHVTSAVHARLSVKYYIQRVYTHSRLTINGVLNDFIKQGSCTD